MDGFKIFKHKLPTLGKYFNEAQYTYTVARLNRELVSQTHFCNEFREAITFKDPIQMLLSIRAYRRNKVLYRNVLPSSRYVGIATLCRTMRAHRLACVLRRHIVVPTTAISTIITIDLIAEAQMACDKIQTGCNSHLLRRPWISRRQLSICTVLTGKFSRGAASSAVYANLDHSQISRHMRSSNASYG